MNVEIVRGLIAADRPVPLEGVRIDVQLQGSSVDVTVTQRYRNREAVPVEALYVFPLEESAAVCGFAACIGDQLVRAKVEERDEAFEHYDDALMRGDGAFLLDQERPNVFTASVGSLRPKETVELQVRYVALATREGNAIRLTIPTTVSPRYVPAGPAEIGQPDGERVNPEIWPKVPYGLELFVKIDKGQLSRIESPSHPIGTTFENDGVVVKIASETTALDRDFVLLVERQEPGRPEVVVAQEADGTRVAMVTFVPDNVEVQAGGHEVIFLLDCSGSMAGQSINQAKRALLLCVRALGTEDTFNVVRFGSSYEALWNAPRSFDDNTLDQASRYIERIEADLGGTEILKPLKALLEKPSDLERSRRVLILTDGQVSNEDQVLEVARQHNQTSRIFTFGIGAGASEYLVRGTARASRGAAEMIFPGERIEPKVLRMFARVRMAVLDDARVDWKGLRVEQAPSRVPPLFSGEALTLFARIEGGEASEIELVAGERRWTVPLDANQASAKSPIPTLWAREAIRELEDATTRRGSSQQRGRTSDKRRDRVIELATRYSLMSGETSFVAVQERSYAEQTNSPTELRRIPVALTSGWGNTASPSAGVFKSRLAGASPLLAMACPAPAPAAPSPARRSPAAQAFLEDAGPPQGGILARAKRAMFGEKALVTSDLSVTSATSDVVYDLLMTQRADGSFLHSPALQTLLGTERAARLSIAVTSENEALVVTATAIALLEREHSDRESEWRPAVTKAKGWLKKQSSTFDPLTVL